MWLAGAWGARLGVVLFVRSVLRRSGRAVRPCGLGGRPRGCPRWGPVPWSRVLSGSLPLEVCRVLWGGASWPPRLRWVPSSPVPLPPWCPLSWVSRPCPLPPVVPVPLPLCWLLLWPRSSPGGEGVVLGCAAVFSAAPPVGVAPCPLVGVPSFPCAGSGGWWARAGAVRGVSGPCCGGASWRACTSGGRAVLTGDGAVLVLPLWRAITVCAPWCPSLRPIPLCHSSGISFFWPFGGFLPPCCVAPVPCPCGRLPATLGLSLPPCRGPFLCPFPSGCGGGWVGGGPVGRR